MLPITNKITLDQRDYLDRVIKSGEMASYGHSLRYLIQYHRKSKRVIAVLKADNARLKGMMEVIKGGQVGQETQFENVGNTLHSKNRYSNGMKKAT